MNLPNSWNVRFAGKTITKVLFFIYLLVLCWIVLLKFGVQFSYMGNRSVNSIPFGGDKISIAETSMNVLIFIPLGIYVQALFDKRSIQINSLFIFMISLLFESMQYILKLGAFDSTDIITNTFGGMIGIMIVKAFNVLSNNKINTTYILNIVGSIGTILMIIVLCLLKMNWLPIRYQ